MSGEEAEKPVRAPLKIIAPRAIGEPIIVVRDHEDREDLLRIYVDEAGRIHIEGRAGIVLKKME